MANRLTYYLKEFTGGLNDKVAPNLLNPTELVECQNAIIGPGFIAKRHGFKKDSNTDLAEPIQTIFPFYKSDKTREILALSGTKLYKYTSNTFTAVTGTLTNAKAEMITYKTRDVKDVVLIADGGKLKAYDGTDLKEVTPYSPTEQEQTNPGLNDLTNLTNVRNIALKKGRIFIAGHPTHKNRVSFTHIDSVVGYSVYDYFPAVNFFDVATQDNDEITKLMVFRHALIIFMKRSVYALLGDGASLNDLELVKINTPEGAIAPDSIKVVGDSIFYLSSDHVCRLYNTDQNFISAEIVSDRVVNTLKTMPNKSQAAAIYFKNKYYLTFPNGKTLVYDELLGCWGVWDIAANCYIEIDDELYFGKNAIYKFDETLVNDDGQPIHFRIKTKQVNFDNVAKDKKIKRLHIFTKQFQIPDCIVDVETWVNSYYFGVTEFDTDVSGVYDQGFLDKAWFDFIDVVRIMKRIRFRGNYIQLALENKKLDQPCVIYGLVFEYRLKR